MDPRAKVSFQQVRVVPSGCMQRRGLGNLHIVGSDATGAFFAFASTLAVYVYEATTFRLHRLLSTKDNVLGLAWCPFACHSAYLATVAMEGGVVLWNVTTEEILFQATLPTAQHAISLQWQPHDTSTMQLAIACSDKLIYVWTVDLEASTHSMARLLPKPTESPMTVLRWNLQTRGMLAIGFESGAIGLYHASRPASLTLITREKKRDKKALAITDMTWDSLSHLYLLVAYKDGHSALWEINEATGTQLHTFDKQGAGTNAIAWLPSAPGQFVTANARSGILKIWNVSQPQPLQHVRAQSSGIHNVAVLRDHRLLCAAVDGSVGVYDLQKRHLAWASHPGHKETIFDVRYQPSNPNVLATCSHDSSVRIWDVETMHCLQHLQGQDGVLYSVAWSPTHAALIASSSSVGSVFLWDVAVGVATVQMRHHTDAVYRVAWDTGADGLLASSSKDKTVVLALPSGVLVKRYGLPGAAFGCDWSPRGDGLLVVGCMDHVVRIFATKTASTEPLRVLAAPDARVFHTVWYADPARLLLATSSDDCTIRVWAWPEDDAADAVVPYITLTGHTGFVRALAWHAAPAPLLLSGSWDATIRIWDIHSRSCRLVVVDHLADVYGIATHPSTPCTFVSCSRDSTLRFWGLRTYESATTLLATVLSTPDVAQIEAAFVVAGMLPGLSNLFALLRHRSTREMRIQREESVVETYLEHARRLEAGLATSRRPSKTTRLNKEEHLLQAAATYLKAGNLVRYCRILADMNQWEKALAAAPGVSMSFWEKLATEYAEHLAATESEDAAVYYVATRNVESAVALYHGRNQFEDAFVVAKASETMAGAASVSSHDSPRQQDWSALRHSSRAALAAQYVDAGDPILAACCYLSVHDVESAISVLLRGDQARSLELAYVLSTYLSTDESPRHFPVGLVRRLAFKYEALGALPLVLQLLGTLPPLEAKYETWLLCARQARLGRTQTLSARLLEKTELEPELRDALAGDRLVDAVRLYLLLGDEAEGLHVAISEVFELLGAPEVNWPAVFAFTSILGSYDAAAATPKQRATLLAVMAFVGAVQAMDARSPVSVVSYLFHVVHTQCHGAARRFPIAEPALLEAEADYCASRDLGRLQLVLTQLERSRGSWPDALEARVAAWRNVVASPPRNNTVFVQVSHAEEALDTLAGRVEAVVVPGSNLPSAGQAKFPLRSLFTGEIIHGPSIKLEDDVSAISLDEAIMWSRVNPFSPLSTGERLSVYSE